LKLTATHPLLFLTFTALVTSALLPAVLAVITGSGHAVIASFERLDPDGIHVTTSLLMVAWPAVGISNFVAFWILGGGVLLLTKRSGRQRSNKVLIAFAVAWCVAVGTLVGVQTVG